LRITLERRPVLSLRTACTLFSLSLKTTSLTYVYPGDAGKGGSSDIECYERMGATSDTYNGPGSTTGSGPRPVDNLANKLLGTFKSNFGV